MNIDTTRPLRASLKHLLPSSRNGGQPVLQVCLLLTLATLVLYLPIATHDFINFDDDAHIYKNAHILSGLSWSSVLWAFGTSYFGTWHPLTWISYMVDYELYGLNPAGYHLTNILFHSANGLLVFLLLNRATGAVWRSAFVAAVFAWHPLRVESVAWAVERKDVLSTFFFLLTLLAYVRYVNALNASSKFQVRSSGLEFSIFNFQFSILSPSSACYVLSLALFAFALMSKAMVVTLPFVLLLLDYWPLRRFQPADITHQFSTIKRLIVEKLPFFILAGAASAATFFASKEGGAMSSLETVPFNARVANAIIGYVRYVTKTFWPTDLAVLYPYQPHWTLSVVAGAALLLAMWTAFCLLKAKSYPYLVVGWFWFLGTLVPTIGVVQVGYQSIADRFTYIPSIGLLLMLAWGLERISCSSSQLKKIYVSLGAASLIGCMACTRAQIPYWQNSTTLFTHAIEVTRDNYVIYEKLGEALNEAGHKEEAMRNYRESARIRPDWAEGQYNLGTSLMEMGKTDEAITHLEAAIADDPNFAAAYNNLGKALIAQGLKNEGIARLSQSVRLEPHSPQFHYSLGTALLNASRTSEAASELLESVRLDPRNPSARMNLAVTMIRQGRSVEAIVQFSTAVSLSPGDPEARFKLGLALLEENRFQDAATQFSEGLRINPNDVKTHYRLAVTMARMGKTQEAAAHYREAIRLAPDFTEARNELANLTTSN